MNEILGIYKESLHLKFGPKTGLFPLKIRKK